MGLMDKAKELAAKAEQQLSSMDGPNFNKQAEPLFARLGALAFDREQGRPAADAEATHAELVEQLRAIEAQAGVALQPPVVAQAPTAPPPPGAAASAPPPPGAASAPPPPAPAPPAAAAPVSPPPPPPGAVAPPPPPGTVGGD